MKPNDKTVKHLGLIALAFAGVSSPLAQAASQTWTNSASDSLWNTTSANWTGAVWTNNNDAVFGATGVGSIAVASDVIVNNIAFNTAGYTLTGNLMLANDKASTFTVSADATISAIIADNTAGASSLSTLGNGTLTLSGSNSYSGGTTIGNTTAFTGAIRATSSGALGSGTVSIIGNSSQSRLELAGGITLANAITQSGRTTGATATASILNVSGSNTLSGTISVTTGGTYSTIQSDSGLLTLSNATAITVTGTTGARGVLLTGAGDIAVTGAITNGSSTGGLQIDKQGAGTATLSGANTYSGATTVSAGTLVVNGNSSTSILTTVNNNGTLGGFGTVGALTVMSGGTVAPGSGLGILSAGNTDLQTGSTLSMDINGSALGTGYDQLNITGTVSLAGALSLNLGGFTPVNSDLFFILANDSTDAITGTFSNAQTDGETYTFDGQDFRISYFGDTTGGTFTGGNDVVLMAIPEPQAALLGGLGMLALLRRRRVR